MKHKMTSSKSSLCLTASPKLEQCKKIKNRKERVEVSVW